MSDTIQLLFVGGPADSRYIRVDRGAEQWHVAFDALTDTPAGTARTCRYTRRTGARDRNHWHYFAPSWMKDEEALIRFLECHKGEPV